MSKAHSVKLTKKEQTQLLKRIDAKQPAGHVHIASGRCAACNKVLEETEIDIKGYASGAELGLCRRDAGYVNSKANIEAAIASGHEVHASCILLTENING